MVEQSDTEEFELLFNSGAANGTELQFHEPPVLTKTWFHLGAYFRNRQILEHYTHEYWYNHPKLKQLYDVLENKEYQLPDAIFTGTLMTELIEAHRACKGMVLRQEVFALDGSEKELLPYSVATHNCNIKKIQPGVNHHQAVFIVQESEAINFSYERKIDDPRISHSLNIEIDELGNVFKNRSRGLPEKKKACRINKR